MEGRPQHPRISRCPGRERRSTAAGGLLSISRRNRSNAPSLFRPQKISMATNDQTKTVPQPAPAPPAPAPTAPGPLFIVSMWRGGSSLLYALLNKHPQVALMFEADLLCLRSVFLKPKAFCDWAERWEFRNDAFRRHGLAATDV